MDYPSVESVWKPDAYVVLQILVSPNGDNGWPTDSPSCPIGWSDFAVVYNADGELLKSYFLTH